MRTIVQLGPLPLPADYATPADLAIVRAFDAEARAALPADCVAAIVTNSGVGMPAELWGRFPALRLIANFGVGLDRIDLDEARRRGVTVTYTPDVLSGDVADLALTLTLALLRRVPAADAFVRAGGWSGGPFPPATSAGGRRMGILGFGRIGRAIAARARAFGMEIGHHARTGGNATGSRFFATPVALAEWADILVAAVPGGPGTDGIVSAEVIAALGPQGLFVNIARASVVDEDALVAAMAGGRLAGIGTELFDPATPLRQRLGGFANVLMTPHIGSSTVQTRTAMADAVFANVRAFLADAPLRDVAG